MELTVVSKSCRTCNKLLRGRTDKKFCDDQCRNVYNNQFKTDKNDCVRKINNWLLKNRRILEQMLIAAGEMAIVNKERLENRGFLFRYYTQTYTNKKGNTYFYCYEYGYMPLDNDRYLIVKRKED
jgi:hypothetical protein